MVEFLHVRRLEKRNETNFYYLICWAKMSYYFQAQKYLRRQNVLILPSCILLLLMSESSGVMACISVTYGTMKFDETWTKIRQKYDKIKYDGYPLFTGTFL